MDKTGINLALMTGIDIPIPELQLVCHSPTVKDIAYMGESEFFTALQYLCIDKERVIQDKTLLSTISNFQILMKVIEQPENQSKRAAIITLLMLLFPNYQVVITPRSINLVCDTGDPIMIDQDNFDGLQDIVKEVLCVSNLFQDQVTYKPANEMAKRIAEKIYKGRQVVAKIKAKQGEGSVLVRYLSILVIGARMRISDCAELNLFQLFDLMERYTAKVEWDADMSIRLAGGKPEQQVESWMRELHSTK